MTISQLWQLFPAIVVTYPPDQDTLIIYNDIEIQLSDITSLAPSPSRQNLLKLSGNMELQSFGSQVSILCMHMLILNYFCVSGLF